MNFSFKIVIDKRYKKENNTHPLKLRVYSGTDYKEKSIGIFIEKVDWDNKNQLVLESSINHGIFNHKIISLKNKAEKLLLMIELNRDINTNLEDVLKSITGTSSPKISHKGNRSIIKYGEEIIKQLTSIGKVGNAFVYSCAVNKLKTFVGNNYPFEDLTYKKLCEFQDFMLADQIKVNTISVYMRTIRALFNRAIREGLIPATCYPFTAYRIKNEKTVNRTLTLKEMQSIIKLKLTPDTPIWHWRNYFLLSFCLIGINFADLLTLTGDNIHDGRVIFRRKKTGKIYTILLQAKAIKILNYYTNVSKPEKGELLLPILKQTKDPVKLKKDIWQAIKTCNEYLVRIAKIKEVDITKDISTYYGRYTWANIARSLGYSKEIIGQALGHLYGNTTTSIYLDDYDQSVIDEVNAKVIDEVLKNTQ